MKIKLTILMVLQTLCFKINADNSESLENKQSECEGAGLYEFGTKEIGELDDERSPFIFGRPEGKCTLKPGEGQKIVKQFLEEASGTTASPVAVFIIGGSGCGKSTSLNMALKELGYKREQFVTIDPDGIRAAIGAYQQATNIPSQICPGKKRAYQGVKTWCGPSGFEIKQSLRQAVYKDKRSFIWDETCEDSTRCEKEMERALEAGYKIYIIGVWADINTCVKRAAHRALETGRLAPSHYVKSSHKTIEHDKAFRDLAAIAYKSGGDAYIFDNDKDPTRKIFQGTFSKWCSLKEKACRFFFSRKK